MEDKLDSLGNTLMAMQEMMVKQGMFAEGGKGNIKGKPGKINKEAGLPLVNAERLRINDSATTIYDNAL